MFSETITSKSTESDLIDDIISNLRLSDNFEKDDNFIKLCIEAAIDTIEGRAGTYIHTVTGELSSPSFTGDLIDCSVFPLTAITGCIVDGVALSTEDYAQYGQYILLSEESNCSTVRIRFTGGYGRNVPQSVILAIVKMASRALSDPLYGYPIDEGILNLITPITRMIV